MRRAVRALLGAIAPPDPSGSDEERHRRIPEVGGNIVTYNTDTSGSSYSYLVPAGDAAEAASRNVTKEPDEPAEVSQLDKNQLSADREAEILGLSSAGAGKRHAADSPGGVSNENTGGPVVVPDAAVSPARAEIYDPTLQLYSKAATPVPAEHGPTLPPVIGPGPPPPTPNTSRYALRSRGGPESAPSYSEPRSDTSRRRRKPPSQSAIDRSMADEAGADLSRPMGGTVASPNFRSGAEHSHVVKHMAIDESVKNMEEASTKTLRAFCEQKGLKTDGNKERLRKRVANAMILEDDDSHSTLDRSRAIREANDKDRTNLELDPVGVRGEGVMGENVVCEVPTGKERRARRLGKKSRFLNEVVQPARQEASLGTISGNSRGANVERNADENPEKGFGYKHGTRQTGAADQPEPAVCDRPPVGVTPASMGRTRALSTERNDAGLSAAPIDNVEVADPATDIRSPGGVEPTGPPVLTRSPRGITHQSTPLGRGDGGNVSTAAASGERDGATPRRTMKIPEPRFLDPQALAASRGLGGSNPLIAPSAARTAAVPVGGLPPNSQEPDLQGNPRPVGGGPTESVDAQFAYSSLQGDPRAVQDHMSSAALHIGGAQGLGLRAGVPGDAANVGADVFVKSAVTGQGQPVAPLLTRAEPVVSADPPVAPAAETERPFGNPGATMKRLGASKPPALAPGVSGNLIRPSSAAAPVAARADVNAMAHLDDDLQKGLGSVDGVVQSPLRDSAASGGLEKSRPATALPFVGAGVGEYTCPPPQHPPPPPTPSDPTVANIINDSAKGHHLRNNLMASLNSIGKRPFSAIDMSLDRARIERDAEPVLKPALEPGRKSIPTVGNQQQADSTPTKRHQNLLGSNDLDTGVRQSDPNSCDPAQDRSDWVKCHAKAKQELHQSEDQHQHEQQQLDVSRRQEHQQLVEQESEPRLQPQPQQQSSHLPHMLHGVERDAASERKHSSSPKFHPPPEKKPRLSIPGSGGSLQQRVSADLNSGIAALASVGRPLNLGPFGGVLPSARSKIVSVPQYENRHAGAAAAAQSAAETAKAVVNAAAAATLAAQNSATRPGRDRALPSGLPPRQPPPSATTAVPASPAARSRLPGVRAMPSHSVPGVASSTGVPSAAASPSTPTPGRGRLDSVVDQVGAAPINPNRELLSTPQLVVRPIAVKAPGFGSGAVTPQDVIRTLQNKSKRAGTVRTYNAGGDSARPLPGSAFAAPSPCFFEGRPSVSRRYSTPRRSERPSMVEATKSSHLPSSSGGLVTDLRTPIVRDCRGTVGVPGRSDGVFGFPGRPVAVSASAMKILASLDKVSKENRASSAKRTRSPLGLPPAAKRRRREVEGPEEQVVDGNAAIGGTEWFMNTIRAHASTAAAKVTKAGLPQKSLSARKKLLVGGENPGIGSSQRGLGMLSRTKIPQSLGSKTSDLDYGQEKTSEDVEKPEQRRGQPQLKASSQQGGVRKKRQALNGKAGSVARQYVKDAASLALQTDRDLSAPPSTFKFAVAPSVPSALPPGGVVGGSASESAKGDSPGHARKGDAELTLLRPEKVGPPKPVHPAPGQQSLSTQDTGQRAVPSKPLPFASLASTSGASGAGVVAPFSFHPPAPGGAPPNFSIPAKTSNLSGDAGISNSSGFAAAMTFPVDAAVGKDTGVGTGVVGRQIGAAQNAQNAEASFTTPSNSLAPKEKFDLKRTPEEAGSATPAALDTNDVSTREKRSRVGEREQLIGTDGGPGAKLEFAEKPAIPAAPISGAHSFGLLAAGGGAERLDQSAAKVRAGDLSPAGARGVLSSSPPTVVPVSSPQTLVASGGGSAPSIGESSLRKDGKGFVTGGALASSVGFGSGISVPSAAPAPAPALTPAAIAVPTPTHASTPAPASESALASAPAPAPASTTASVAPSVPAPAHVPVLPAALSSASGPAPTPAPVFPSGAGHTSPKPPADTPEPTRLASFPSAIAQADKRKPSTFEAPSGASELPPFAPATAGLSTVAGAEADAARPKASSGGWPGVRHEADADVNNVNSAAVCTLLTSNSSSAAENPTPTFASALLPAEPGCSVPAVTPGAAFSEAREATGSSPTDASAGSSAQLSGNGLFKGMTPVTISGNPSSKSADAGAANSSAALNSGCGSSGPALSSNVGIHSGVAAGLPVVDVGAGSIPSAERVATSPRAAQKEKSSGATPATITSSGFAFGGVGSGSGAFTATGHSPGKHSSVESGGMPPFAGMASSTTPAFGAKAGDSPLFGASAGVSSASAGALGPPLGPPLGGMSASAAPSAASVFGNAASGAAFGFGSAPFGEPSPAPFGVSSSPAFGAPSGLAFGAASGPAFGSASGPAFGNPAISPFGGSAVASNPFGGSGGNPFPDARPPPAVGNSSAGVFTFGAVVPAQTSAPAVGTAGPLVLPSTPSVAGGFGSFGSTPSVPAPAPAESGVAFGAVPSFGARAPAPSGNFGGGENQGGFAIGASNAPAARGGTRGRRTLRGRRTRS